jgi:hypothetical protein
MDAFILFLVLWLIQILLIHGIHSRYFYMPLAVGILQVVYVVASYQLIMSSVSFLTGEISMTLFCVVSVMILIYGLDKFNRGYSKGE